MLGTEQDTRDGTTGFDWIPGQAYHGLLGICNCWPVQISDKSSMKIISAYMHNVQNLFSLENSHDITEMLLKVALKTIN